MSNSDIFVLSLMSLGEHLKFVLVMKLFAHCIIFRYDLTGFWFLCLKLTALTVYTCNK